ncbi:hypothetical protein [Pseudofrankia sp. BMG5.37]|uniref:hypothetical protein n=1 Tax=Pseudofrankia sp. BMG5.37 TaxID=3050035 RepID=UPI00289527B8|nr:hypothetical protein [Pseudofrankia sp. BMG5.37]MDT3444487.1 hypothetical protein [Pseudofrankia sp. BMG5.37]
MSAIFDALVNRGEYLSAYYVSEQLGEDLRKRVLDGWARREGDEHDPRKTPRELLRGLRAGYLTEERREYFAAAAQRAAEDADDAGQLADDPMWAKRLVEWHQDVLRALGYPSAPAELAVHRAGRDHTLPVAFHGDGIVAVDCGWTADPGAAIDPDDVGARLLAPLRVSGTERYDTGAALAGWLFQCELGGAGGRSPRFVLLLHGGVVILADRRTWYEGRYLAANLDLALEHNDRAQRGELATLAALFSHEMLRPGDNDTAPLLDALLTASSTNAVGVSKELRHGLKKSVEILAGEVLARMAEPDNNVTPDQLASPRMPFAQELTGECLRYLYRIIFLLFAEARPELGIVRADDPSYEAGYSMARLRELAARDQELVDPEAANGFHLYLSLELLFDKVNQGHRVYGTEPDDDAPGDDEFTREEKAARRSKDQGLRFEALRSDLFEPAAIRLIRGDVPHPDEHEGRRLDLRPRNAALHEVLRLLTMKESTGARRDGQDQQDRAGGGRRRERGGFISYRNLGINQLGAVYEGLISYTGTIAGEQLNEVRKSGKGEQGTWLIPSRRQDKYPASALVEYGEYDRRRGRRGPVVHEPGTFAYRLSGRDRETSASYYTPESLTKVAVELALRHRLDQERDADGNTIRTRASELLRLTVCEPALGSGAFLNEAINQIAEEYLRRRQEEAGESIPAADLLTEKQRAKAYVALHSSYGVDLRQGSIELAEVSLWLNTMHPGMQAPWFGLHLRRGNSLIGARRAVYSAADVTSPAKAWLKARGALGPTPLPFEPSAHPQLFPADAVHQFLLPSPGWAAITSGKEAKEARPLAGGQVERLTAWKKGVLQRPKRSEAHLNKDGTPKRNPGGQPKPETVSQFTRLRDAARRAEFLWALVVKRMEISEREISRRIDLWGANPDDPEYAFLRVPQHAVPKEKVLEDLFLAADTPYWRLKKVMDAWCALWFWPLDQVDLLDGAAPDYHRLDVGVESLDRILTAAVPAPLQPQHEELTLFAFQADDAGPDEPEWRLAGDPAATVLVAEDAGADPTATTYAGTFADVSVYVEKPTAAESSVKATAGGSRKPRRPARRRVVPLKDLDDWLDFLEAMLGTADIPDHTLIDAFQTLDELKQYEALLPGFMGMDQGDPEDRFPWLHVVQDIATREGFLHWELDFAYVFARDGGFGLQVGNPPWYRPHWDENGVLAEFEPWFEIQEKPSESERARRRKELLGQAKARRNFLDEVTNIAAQVAYFSSSQAYPLLTGTQPDLYRTFMCQVWAHAAPDGMIGMLHPSTHFTGDAEGSLREEVYHRLRIHGDFVNAGRFFPPPIGHSSHFGIHIYGPRQEIKFDHLSWLVSADALRLSKDHDGSDEVPGVRYRNAEYDERPHRSRVVQVTPDALRVWRRLLDEGPVPLQQARLMFPVSTAEAEAIAALSAYPLRLGAFAPPIASGFHESGAKDAGLIDYSRASRAGIASRPAAWDDVILKGIQLGTANPVFKRHDANSNDPNGLDLVSLPVDFVPDTPYLAVEANWAEYEAARDRERWVDHKVLEQLRAEEELVARIREEISLTLDVPDSELDSAVEARLVEAARRPYTNFYRLAWRRQVAPDTERALYAALIPPAVTHVDAVHSLAMPSKFLTSLVAGFWSSLPLDYFLRVTGRSDLRVASAKAMPAPDREHPLAAALLLRTLRLNCLTTAYADLWAQLYDPTWSTAEGWACEWFGLPDLREVTPDWRPETPLRTERARRSALVEIDALVAVWLGMGADALIAAYKGRFPVLQKYEAVTWFDADGWKLAGIARTHGQRQSKDSWAQLEKFRIAEDPKDVPVGYTPPFYKADREAEMRAAHAVFQKRLDDAVARGEWDPVRREVPGR